MVPPPSVPTSSEGMDTQIWRYPGCVSVLSLRCKCQRIYYKRRVKYTYFFMVVMQLADSTTWAGS